MFASRRRPFNTESPVTGENLTGYDERYELPTDGSGSVGGFGYAQNAQPTQGQTVVQPGLFGQTAFGQAQPGAGTATAVAAEQAPVKERPMVFALRAFSDMFVYEYSDRFEYYRRTPDGMVRCNTEYKQLR